MRPCAHPQLTVFDRKRDTVDAVTLAVAEHLGADIREVRGTSRRQPYARVRMIAMYVTGQITILSEEEIGQALGRDRTTIHYGIKEIATDLQYDPFLRQSVSTCVEKARAALAQLDPL
jgi:chromosomal replication initiator protein